MERTLFSRKDLMERWGVSYQSIVNYENNGILTRNPKFDNPMYYLEEILKIESLTPLERRRLERRIEELEKERDLWKGKVDIIKTALV